MAVERRQYTAEFKQEAVRIMTQGSLSAAQVARDLGINANLLGKWKREFEPVEGVQRLGEFIVHTHAKDARGEGGWGDVPLGEGWVDWPRYLRLLKASGYDGYLAIEREAGDDRVGEIGRAAEFLKEHLGGLEQ